MINIIIVEDDPMVMDINSRFLERIGGLNIVGKAGSIKEAKKVISDIESDLILMDVFLPDGKGIDLLKWVRSEEIFVDTIFITADKCKISVDEAFKYGAVDYLIKPFKYDRFKEAMEKYKERFQNFNIHNNLDQENIDEYILKRRPTIEVAIESELCKGLSVKTYNKIIEFMTDKKGCRHTAEEIAKGSGLARVTARRYLEKMVEENKIEIIQEYGKIGRPTNYYVLL